MADQKQSREAVAQAALTQYEDELLAYPNVTGIGIQDKIMPDGSSEPVVQVYVTQKLPPEQLAAAEMLPSELEVTVAGEPGSPVRQEKIGVQVEETSELKF